MSSLLRTENGLTTDIFVVKYTGRGLVVKRPGVLSKVQMLTLVLGVGAFSLLPNFRNQEKGMYTSLSCGALSAKCTAGPNILGSFLFPWPWHWTRQKLPLLKPPFLGSWIVLGSKKWNWRMPIISGVNFGGEFCGGGGAETLEKQGRKFAGKIYWRNSLRNSRAIF